MSDATNESRPNPRKVREGVVVSDKMNSTLVVAVNERVSHARYGKTVQRTKKLYVHDEKNEAKIGDKVRVQETRPLSKLKRWTLKEIVKRSALAAAAIAAENAAAAKETPEQAS